jgi:hypothetical protein
VIAAGPARAGELSGAERRLGARVERLDELLVGLVESGRYYGR